MFATRTAGVALTLAQEWFFPPCLGSGEARNISAVVHRCREDQRSLLSSVLGPRFSGSASRQPVAEEILSRLSDYYLGRKQG